MIKVMLQVCGITLLKQRILIVAAVVLILVKIKNMV